MEREKIIKDYDKIIKYVIKQMGLGRSFDDYFDVGLVGFSKGINSYDTSKDVKMITYVCACVKKEILAELVKTKAQKRDFQTISLSTCINKNGDGDMELADVVGYVLDDTKKYYLEEIMDSMFDRLSYFNDDYQGIYKHYYGIGNYSKLSIIEIAEKYGKSKSGVAHIVNKINNIMRYYLKEYQKGYFETDFDITPQVIIYNNK